MAMRKSLANFMIESPSHRISLLASPLRRRSLLIQPQGSIDTIQNDDEAERIARRSEIDNSPPSGTTNGIRSNKRRSFNFTLAAQLSEAEIADRISQCIKLNTQNKINVKNAFGVEIIDFMTYMIKKQDVNISNLQVATTSLDVSTKIYGYRVDSVYTDVLQITSGAAKDKHDVENTMNQGTEQENKENDQVGLQTKKRKKKINRKVLSTAESLKGSVETVNPLFMTTCDSDLQTSDMLQQVTLPIHANSGFYLHPFNDVLHDKIEKMDVEEDLLTEIPVQPVENIAGSKICSSFAMFDFLSWSADNEMDKMDDEEEDKVISTFQFDPDAALPSDDDLGMSRPNYFDMDEEEHVEIERLANNGSRVENLVDFREILTLPDLTKSSEYTFVKYDLSIHWAGPSHWKIKQFNRTKGNVTSGCAQKPSRKRKEMELCHDEATSKVMKPKFTCGKGIKLKVRTTRTDWQENRLSLPPDVHYEFTNEIKLFERSDITVKCETGFNQHSPINLQKDNSDCENINDANDNCSNVNDDYHMDDNEVGTEDCDMRLQEDDTAIQLPLTGDNLITLPRIINKETISFCVRPKKIDMRQLKESIWKNLTFMDNNKDTDRERTQNQENTRCVEGSTRFSDVYKALPNSLSKDNAEALSFPIAFASLLHLANEKSLSLSALENMSDIIVKPEQK